MAAKPNNLVIIGSGNGILSAGTQPLPEQICEIFLNAISQEMFNMSITRMCLKINESSVQSHLPGSVS